MGRNRVVLGNRKRATWLDEHRHRQMINNMNDLKLCEHMSKLRRNQELLNHIWAEGGNHAMFLALKNIFDAADDAMHRLNELQTKDDQ
jgi:hypothetical protein